MRTLADGEYDTCPLHGPKVYMPYRRISVTANVVTLINRDPESERDTPDWLKGKVWRFSVADFFSINVLFENKQETV